MATRRARKGPRGQTGPTSSESRVDQDHAGLGICCRRKLPRLCCVSASTTLCCTPNRVAGSVLTGLTLTVAARGEGKAGDWSIDDVQVMRASPALPWPKPLAETDTLWLPEGDQIFGNVTTADSDSVNSLLGFLHEDIPPAGRARHHLRRPILSRRRRRRPTMPSRCGPFLLRATMPIASLERRSA